MTDTAKELLSLDVDALAQEIRRVDGSNSLGAGALAEELIPFIVSRISARQQASVQSSAGRAVIDDDAVVIRFPLDALQSAMDGAWALRALDTRYKITNIDEFAPEFARALNREDEQGTTAIHKMADRAFVDCIENGAFGIEEHEQQDI